LLGLTRAELVYASVVAFASLLISYVESIVLPALPVLVGYFGTNYDTLSWIITGYLIGGAVSSALFGKLADLYGKKRIFVLMAVVFALTVALGGFANNLIVFILIRTFQGIGFAMVPVGFALLNDVVAKQRVAIAQGVASATFWSGAGLGMVFGSWVTQQYGWQWAYHTAVPLALLLVAATILILKESRVKNAGGRIDLTGIVLLTLGLISLMLPISEGEYWGSSATVGLFVLAALLFTVFGFYESRTAFPFLEMKLMKIRNVFLANITMLLALAELFAIFYAVPELIQDPSPTGFGQPIMVTGFVMLPAALVSLVLAPMAGKIAVRYGPKVAILLAQVCILSACFALIFNRGSVIAIAEDMVVLGGGFSTSFVGITNILLLSVPSSSAGSVSGINIVFRNLGNAIGPAVAGVIETIYVVQSGAVPSSATYPSAEAFTIIFSMVAIMTVVSLISALLLKNIIVSGEKTASAVVQQAT